MVWDVAKYLVISGADWPALERATLSMRSRELSNQSASLSSDRPTFDR